MFRRLRPLPAQVKPRTFIERAIVAFFGSIVLLVAFMIYLAYVKTVHYETAVIPHDNGDAVCDDFELLTARGLDKTPCGQFIFYLINLNQGI